MRKTLLTSKINLSTTFAILFCVFIAHASLQAQTEQKAEQKAPSKVVDSKLGDTVNVHQCGSLFTAGQFMPKDIEALKSQKIGRIITLRTDREVQWDEKKTVEDAGMEFMKMPIGSPDDLTDEFFGSLRELLKSETQTMLHCGSASRVGSAWLPFRVLDQGVALETALEEARAIGSRSQAMEAKAIAYIKRIQKENMSNGEMSVRPGVNKNFLDPELDVDKFVKRFEVESREIYLSRNEIVAACAIKPGSKVADVGAGTGLFSRIFSEKTGNDGWVYAVDISTRFLQHINKESAARKIENITGVLCSESSVTLPPNSVDFVFICDTYHHFEYPKSTMKSIHKALKDGGTLVVVDFERIPGTTREWLLDHVRAGKEVFRAEIQDAGFTLVEEAKISGLKENYFLKFKKSN